jgi:hypothetical protein
MDQRQHYNPRTYLQQWCSGHTLLEYRRVGPHARLDCKAKSPRSIAFERGLYTLPEGGVANGMTGTDLESRLARDVDEHIGEVVASVSAVSGLLSDPGKVESVRWLMKTFIARSPGAIRRVEDGIAAIQESQRPLLERMLGRALQPSSRDQIRSFGDPRMPQVAARAGTAAVVASDLPNDEQWLQGDVHIVRVEDVQHRLTTMGAGEFVTFDQPVVEWESHLVASLSLSPVLLALLVERGTPLTRSQYEDAVERHILRPLSHRRSLYCRTKATGELLAAAGTLIPRNPRVD